MEFPKLQFLDTDDMPVVALDRGSGPDVQKTVRCRSCRSSSKNACPYNDRCWLVYPLSAVVLFLDKVVLPVVMQDLIFGLDVQKTVDVPQLQFLTPMVALPVEIPRGAVFGQGLHARRCVWRRWPHSAENCGDSTGASGPDSAETVEDPPFAHAECTGAVFW